MKFEVLFYPNSIFVVLYKKKKAFISPNYTIVSRFAYRASLYKDLLDEEQFIFLFLNVY